MDALLLMTGVSSPGIGVGRENGFRQHQLTGKVSAVGAQEIPATSERRRRGNWALDVLLRPRWSAKRSEEVPATIDDGDRCVACGGGESEGCVVGEDEKLGRKVFDRESFSRLLEKVSLVEAQFFAKMSYLGSLAYCIQKIKPTNLLRNHGLRFVTSSLEKKAKSLVSGEEKRNSQDQESKEKSKAQEGEKWMQNADINENAAYQIAASAASYIHWQTNGVLPSGSDSDDNGLTFSTINGQVETDEFANVSFLATSNSVTAVVSAKEETKQAIAEDLNSAKSSPCEWYICDDDNSATRYFVIQGSETLDSWKTNLLFEPVEFEGLDVLVHRGIYEAAKGIYQQMLPEIREHLKSHGNSATLRFTGHSLGGSLGLLVNLMLLIRGEAPASSLLPIVTFGAPSILCGGDYLLRKLGLPKSHVQAISMHRDIVPRAFSCFYPDHVANILKTVNSKFRNLSCLTKMKLLYAPMGKFFILQPEEKYSPHHHLLPPGSGLYLFGNSQFDSDKSRLLQEALLAFLSSPHPLEILSDRAAYGSQGTVYRDHDPSSYLRSVRNVVCQEFKLIRKAWIEQQNRIWGPVVALHGIISSYTEVRRTGIARATQNHISFGGVFSQNRKRLKRFTRLVTSQQIHILAAILLPGQLLLLDKISFFSSSWLQC